MSFAFLIGADFGVLLSLVKALCPNPYRELKGLLISGSGRRPVLTAESLRSGDAAELREDALPAGDEGVLFGAFKEEHTRVIIRA